MLSSLAKHYNTTICAKTKIAYGRLMAVQPIEPLAKSARYRSKKSICLTSIATTLAEIHGLRPLQGAMTLATALHAN